MAPLGHPKMYLRMFHHPLLKDQTDTVGKLLKVLIGKLLMATRFSSQIQEFGQF